MRILTVLRQVPDSNAKIKIASDGKSIETTGLKLVMNPFAEFAVEQAIRLREQGLPVDEIVALTIGGDKAGEILRTALAMGADRGIHLCDDAFISHDEIFQAAIIAQAVKQQSESFDLVLCGKQDIDNDSGELAPALAEYLDIPHIGAIVKLEIEGETVKARRRVEGAEEVMESPLPVLLSAEKGLCEARYPSLPNLMKAKKKPVEKITAAELQGFGEAGKPGSEILSLSPPAERTACKFIEGEPEEMSRELVRVLREEAKVI